LWVSDNRLAISSTVALEYYGKLLLNIYDATVRKAA